MPGPMNGLLAHMICINCRSHGLQQTESALVCGNCGKAFPIINGIPCFVSAADENFSEVEEKDRQRFLEAKRLAYFSKSFISSMYNHYHKYAAARRKGVSGNGVILDIGCGVGEHYPYVSAGEKGRFLGIDIDRFKLEHFHNLHPEFPVAQANAFNLPFADASIDVVQLLATIEHFSPTEIVELMDEILRILRSGGLLIVCYPAEGSVLLRGCQRLVHSLIRSRTGFDLDTEEIHHHASTAGEIRESLLKRPELKLLENSYYPFHLRCLNLALFINETYTRQ